jgi:hypothetical protein
MQLIITVTTHAHSSLVAIGIQLRLHRTKLLREVATMKAQVAGSAAWSCRACSSDFASLIAVSGVRVCLLVAVAHASRLLCCFLGHYSCCVRV